MIVDIMIMEHPKLAFFLEFTLLVNRNFSSKQKG